MPDNFCFNFLGVLELMCALTTDSLSFDWFEFQLIRIVLKKLEISIFGNFIFNEVSDTTWR